MIEDSEKLFGNNLKFITENMGKTVKTNKTGNIPKWYKLK